MLVSATLYACGARSNDPASGGAGALPASSGGATSVAGGGGHTSVAGGGDTNVAGGGSTSLAVGGGATNMAGGGGTNNAGAASTPQAGSSGQGVGCTGTRPSCTTGGAFCSDVFTPAQCVNGAWACPSGSFPPSQCQCVGAPLLCHPGKAGGACTAERVQANCSGGTWTCPVGTVSVGACLCVLSDTDTVAGAGGEAGSSCP